MLHRARLDPKNPLTGLTSPVVGYMARLSLTSIASFAWQSILRSSFDGFPPLIPILVLVLTLVLLLLLLRDTVISILIGYRPSWTVAVPLFLIIGRLYGLSYDFSKPWRARRWRDDNEQLRFQTSQRWTQRQQPELLDV